MKGCILPSGNRYEFANLDAELKKRGITAEIKNLKRGGRIYRIQDSQLHLLPHDELGPYLGDDDSGHSIYEIDETMMRDFE
jgi:hypothetical protein